jgi:VanZ family protein
MAVIFYLSSIPDPGNVPGGVSDKFLHLLAYGALGAAFLFALADGRLRGVTTRTVLLAIVFGSLYGLSDELHQSFVPHRAVEVLDLVADAVGAALGAGIGAIAASLLRTSSTRRE